MGRGTSSKKMRCQNRAMARGKSTSGNSRAQAFMKPGHRAPKLRREPIEDVHTTIVVDNIRYIVSYKADIFTGTLVINHMVSEKTYQGLIGNKATREGKKFTGREVIPMETQHKVGMALCKRLSEAAH